MQYVRRLLSFYSDPMKVLSLWLTMVALWAQTPQFGPDNPESLVLFPSKTGRYAWKRKGEWNTEPLQTRNSRTATAAITPADASRPACFLPAPSKDGRYRMQGMIHSSGSAPGCVDLVMDNWDYFDARLSRATPQLLVMHSLGRCANVVDGKLVLHRQPPTGVPPQGCFKHVPIWEEMDWNQVAAILAP